MVTNQPFDSMVAENEEELMIVRWASVLQGVQNPGRWKGRWIICAECHVLAGWCLHAGKGVMTLPPIYEVHGVKEFLAALQRGCK